MSLIPRLLSDSEIENIAKQVESPDSGEYHPSSRCLHDNKSACRHCLPIRKLLAHIYALETAGKSGSAKATVGVVQVEIKPGDDGVLGTADDVVIKKAAPKKKAPAKKKPAAKKAAPKKKSTTKKS